MVIALGASDEALEELGGRTPIEAASMPGLLSLAQNGRVGWAAVGAEEAEPTVARGLLSALGYDPDQAGHVGAACMAQAMGVGLRAREWAMDFEWVATVTPDGTPSAAEGAQISGDGVIDMTASEDKALREAVLAAWRVGEPTFMSQAELVRGHERTILVDRSERTYAGVETVSALAAGGEAWDRVLPGRGRVGVAALMRRLMSLGRAAIEKHAVTLSRREQGLVTPTMPWLSCPAGVPTLKKLGDRFGLRGAMVSVEPMAVGLAAMAGWELVGPKAIKEGEDEAQKLGEAALDALGEFDVVCCVLQSAAQTSARGDVAGKVTALEAIDRHVVGPMARRLLDFGDPTVDAGARGWRMMFTPGCGWPVGDLGPTGEAAPVVLAGAWIRSIVKRACSEAGAQESDLKVERGHDLFEYFLLGGLAKATVVGRKPAAKRGETGELW